MKRILSVFVILLFLAAPMACFADNDSVDTEYIFDFSALLTEEQLAELEAEAERVSQQCGCGIYVLTIDDYLEHGYEEGELWMMADTIYERWELGVGAQNDGIVLVVSLAGRNYEITTYGDFADAAVANYGEDTLAEEFLPDFRADDWYSGIYNYIAACRQLFSGTENTRSENAAPEHVFDLAELLTAEQLAELEAEAARVSQRYDCGVYVLTINDCGEYGYSGSELWKLAESVYKQWNLGYGAQNDGVMLVLSMAERDYDITAYGDFANASFTDYGKEALANEFLPDFRVNDWYSGFYHYITFSQRMLDMSAQGEPLDNYDDGGYTRGEMSVGTSAAIGAVPGLLSAFGVCGAFKRGMKNARTAVRAEEYVRGTDIKLNVREDIYTHTTEQRTRINTDSGGRSGGGGTSVNSGGFSHSSGKF